MKGKMPKNYYDYMYDIEGLTKLNGLRKNKKISLQSKIENLIRGQRCTEALHLLRRNFNITKKQKELEMILFAINIKNILFKSMANFSPKYCALIELSKYLKLDKNTVERKMVVEEPVHEDWNRMNVNTEDENDINRFYMKTQSYIYELMAANYIIQTLFTFGVMSQRMQKLGVNKVLDYGGGAGTISILLSELGFDVTYADLKSETSKFAKWRFLQRKLKIPMLKLYGDVSTDLKKINVVQGQFDSIVCTEVVEHVLRPMDLVKSFAEVLKPGGVLIVSESCEYVEQFSSHLKTNTKYGGDTFVKHLKKFGFYPVEVDFFIPQQIYIKK